MNTNRYQVEALNYAKVHSIVQPYDNCMNQHNVQNAFGMMHMVVRLADNQHLNPVKNDQKLMFCHNNNNSQNLNSVHIPSALEDNDHVPVGHFHMGCSVWLVVCDGIRVIVVVDYPLLV